MKVIYGKCLVSVIVIMLLAANSIVFQVRAVEPGLVGALNAVGFTNIAESSVETFKSGTYNVTLYAEFAGFCNENELSFYEVNSTVYELIFSGPEGGWGYITPPISKNFTSPGQFGISMYTPECHRYCTENFLNLDGQNHSKVYLNLDNSNMYLIGFENLYGLGDRDFDDFVFSLELMQPEPTQYCLSVVSEFGVAGGEGLYDSGTYAHASLDTEVIDYGNGTQSVFTGWSGDASGTNYLQSDPILMDQNKTAVANWITNTTIVTAADFTYSPSFPEMFEDVVFDASSSNGTIAEFLWDFGDGNVTGTGDPVIAHQFGDFGTFNVSLTVTDVGGGNDTMWRLIKISGRPSAAFTYAPVEPRALEEVAFNASGSEANGGSIVSYAWDFGDGAGNTTSALTVKHTYAGVGGFNVTLTVTDDEGLLGTSFEMVTVLPGVRHDVAVLNVATNTPHEYAGRIVNITVTVRNNGEVSESFDLKAYRNSTLINTIHVADLGVGEELTVIIPWNTSFLIAGKSWRINATAVVVGDVNLADNVFVDGLVYIKMMGDANADGTVDIFDVAAAALAFGSVEGDPNWNPQADVMAPRGLVDVHDIVGIVLHFGEVAEP
jgi:PKD repeat protein